MQIPRCSTEASATRAAALSYSFTSFFLKKKPKNCAWLEKAVQQEPGIHGLFFFSTSDMPSEIPNPFQEQDTFLQCNVFAQGFFSMYVQIIV